MAYEGQRVVEPSNFAEDRLHRERVLFDAYERQVELNLDDVAFANVPGGDVTKSPEPWR